MVSHEEIEDMEVDANIAMLGTDDPIGDAEAEWEPVTNPRRSKKSDAERKAARKRRSSARKSNNGKPPKKRRRKRRKR